MLLLLLFLLLLLLLLLLLYLLLLAWRGMMNVPYETFGSSLYLLQQVEVAASTCHPG